jgi:hypothetical protein
VYSKPKWEVRPLPHLVLQDSDHESCLVIFVLCSLCSCFSPPSFCFNSSILVGFELSRLFLDGQGHVLKCFTKGNPQIPHELIHRGLFHFREKTCSCTIFLRFTEFWFILGHDPLEVAFILPGESLCKVASRSELVWLSFGLEIDFSRSLLVHTRHVRWAYRTCPVDKLSILELKFCRDLPQGV